MLDKKIGYFQALQLAIIAILVSLIGYVFTQLQKHGAVAYHHFFVYNLRIRYHSHHLISLDSQKHQRIGGLMNGIDILVVCSTLGTLIVMWVGILIICLKNA